MGASRGKAVRSGGAHIIFLIKNMKSATAFCPDRLCFGDSASCYLSLWNTMAVHIFYSEHTVYFPDSLCFARSMAELCSIQKALHKGELFGVAYFLVILLGFICFTACFCELVAAGCILKSTFNSTDFFLYLGNCESFNELWDGLKISVAASCKLYVMYYISIEVKLNLC